MSRNIRAVLLQWGYAPGDIRRYQNQIRAFQDKINDYRQLQALNYNGGPRSTAISDPTGRKAIKILNIMECYEETIRETTILLNRTCHLMTEVDKALNEVSPMQREIAYLRYREHQKWVYITMKLSISDAWARRLDEETARFVTERLKSSEL